MTITVLVPSYNHAPFVEKTLRSIFKQTLAPEKLIVIDDGSKDESPEIIERVLQDCPFNFQFIKHSNHGLSATLNEGFSLVRSNYFAYLGSDDVWLPTFLEQRINILEKRQNAVLAFGHAFLIDEEDRIIDCTRNWTQFVDGNMLPLLLRGVVFPSPSVVYRRSAVEKYNWNEDSILEDYELYLKLSSDGEFALDDNVLCAWRQHNWNVSRDFPLMLQEWIAAQNRVADKLKISRQALSKIQTELKFNSVFDYIRHGKKKEAFSLMRENVDGAKSIYQLIRMLFRLAIPQSLFQWNRKRKKQKSVVYHGKLRI